MPLQVKLDRKKLKKLREQNNLTQEKLAELSNISDRHLRNLEAASVNPSATVLCRLSLVLDVSMDELMIVTGDETE